MSERTVDKATESRGEPHHGTAQKPGDEAATPVVGVAVESRPAVPSLDALLGTDPVKSSTTGAPAVAASSAPVRTEPTFRELQREAEAKARALRQMVAHAAAAMGMAAEKLGAAAPDVLLRLFDYASNPESPHHEWAMKLVAERLLPAKGFAAVAASAVEAPKTGTERPTVTIQIVNAVPAGGPQPLDVEATVTVTGSEDQGANLD